MALPVVCCQTTQCRQDILAPQTVGPLQVCGEGGEGVSSYPSLCAARRSQTLFQLRRGQEPRSVTSTPVSFTLCMCVLGFPFKSTEYSAYLERFYTLSLGVLSRDRLGPGRSSALARTLFCRCPSVACPLSVRPRVVPRTAGRNRIYVAETGRGCVQATRIGYTFRAIE